MGQCTRIKGMERSRNRGVIPNLEEHRVGKNNFYFFQSSIDPGRDTA